MKNDGHFEKKKMKYFFLMLKKQNVIGVKNIFDKVDTNHNKNKVSFNELRVVNYRRMEF